MTHAHHDALDGYDARQILHDGCTECEDRAENIERALGNLDHNRFEKAWRRAFDRFGSRGDADAVGPVSNAEFPLLTALWAVQVHLEKRGVPLDGTPPGTNPKRLLGVELVELVEKLDAEQLDGIIVGIARDQFGDRVATGTRISLAVLREAQAAGLSPAQATQLSDAVSDAFLELDLVP